MYTSVEIREKFLDFFKKRGHKIVLSSSLIPDDSSVLFTTAGMQQFKKYYTGELDVMVDFGMKNTTSIQKTFRTSDINGIGDESHLTFFEMLGNFSFGGYFKKEAIQYAYDFITKEMGLEISYVTFFKGSKKINIPKDEESEKIWKLLGIKNVREEGIEDVFWGPTGNSGPCGPTTEIYCKNKNGKDIEIWNIVFNQYFYSGTREELLSEKSNKKLKLLKKHGVDTGMGMERLVMISQNTKTVFETDLFSPIIDILSDKIDIRTRRIIVDHIRSITFLLSDGVYPSNKESGYILRKLMRRVIVYRYLAGDYAFNINDLLKKVCDIYKPFYSNITYTDISKEMELESEKFYKTLKQGLKELNKIDEIDSRVAFKLYESFGLPYEIIKEVEPKKTKKLNRRDFDKEFERHKKISRAGTEKKFGGHGLVLDTGELKAGSDEEIRKVRRLHTATHLLQAGLRSVLEGSIRQMGSDITSERLRFDFNFSRKLTEKEKQKIEDFVNKIVDKNLPVQFEEMSKKEAKKTGALFFFKEKYPEKVKVYFIGNSIENAVSKEFCGGPHVIRTGEIGHMTITKEKSVGSGIRRIKAKID